jgi:hypothetical protein
MACTPLAIYYPGDQIKKNELGGAGNTYSSRRGAYWFLWGRLREESTWKT